MPVNARPCHGQAVHLLVLLSSCPEQLQALGGLQGRWGRGGAGGEAQQTSCLAFPGRAERSLTLGALFPASLSLDRAL